MKRLIISNLSKTYPNGVKALDGINLEIPQGMFGLLGPNGAGKSSLMRTIATLQEADEGDIEFEDRSINGRKDEIRKISGYLPQQFGLYPRLSSLQLLDHFAILKGLTNRKNRRAKIEALLYKTNLYDVRHRKLGSFSGGMKQRFGIAQALLADPKILIVDEPTAGLDPKERNQLYFLLSEISEEAIVILSTHIVEDVVELCTRMAIIHKGKVVTQGKPLELIEAMQNKVFQKIVHKSEIEDLKAHYRVINMRYFQGKPLVQILSNTSPHNGFLPSHIGLEEVYFSHLSN